MFESAELGHKISKARYKKELPMLRAVLLDIQLELLMLASFPAIIVLGGVDGAGRGETVNLLNEWIHAILKRRAWVSRQKKRCNIRKCGATGKHCPPKER